MKKLYKVVLILINSALIYVLFERQRKFEKEVVKRYKVITENLLNLSTRK